MIYRGASFSVSLNSTVWYSEKPLYTLDTFVNPYNLTLLYVPKGLFNCCAAISADYNVQVCYMYVLI